MYLVATILDGIGLVNDVNSNIKSMLNSFFKARVVLEKADMEIKFIFKNSISRLGSLSGF